MKNCNYLIVIISVLIISCKVLALDCPPMPTQVKNDSQINVKAAVGRIGPIKGAELEAKTASITKDLLEKLPNSDKVYLEQMMFSAYCSALRDDKTLKESEKASLIKRYRNTVMKTISEQTKKNIPSTQGKTPHKNKDKNKSASSNTQTKEETSSGNTINQNMVNSPGGMQAGRDININQTVYKPLQDTIRIKIINKLSTIHTTSSGDKIKFSVYYELGNNGRQRVALELIDILKNAGFKKIDDPISGITAWSDNGVHPAIIVEINPDDFDITKTIFDQLLNSLFKVDISLNQKAEFSKGKISIKIFGDPIFANDGSVSFP